jgi:uncharacterized protein (TIGR00159 family)
MLGFLHFGIIDLLDILIVAYLFYQFYNLISNSVAEKIFYVIIAVYFIWVLVKALHFRLLGTIMGDIISVGVIALLIVFQQEVRRFLLLLASKSYENFTLRNLPKIFFGKSIKKTKNCKIPLNEILVACEYLRDRKIGALIVVSDRDDLTNYFEAGQIINAEVKATLIETIFFKNTPLHDGAMFIVQDKIRAAGCVLPLTERTDLPYYLGLRHRAAIGLSEYTSALVIVVSEERGQISFAEFGKIYIGVDIPTLKQKIEKKFFEFE